ncbi:MAG: ArsR/SmtB family transcription factor [Gammaproteobacteria bacterium]
MATMLDAAADQVFDALGDATRRSIIARLTDSAQSVSSLAAPLGITVTAVAQHLRVLEAAGLIQTVKTGRVRSCSLRPDGFLALERWVLERKPRWEQRFDRLADLLDEEDGQP